MTSGIFQHQYRSERVISPTEGTKFIYEVIRVKNGHPLFLKEHLDRLLESHKLVYGTPLADMQALCKDCFRLIKQEEILNQNIRIEVFYQPKRECAVFAVPSFYPDQQMVEAGARLITIAATREDPHAKVDPRAFRKTILVEMERHGAFEAALVSEDGKVTEGTRSNLFFIRNGTVYTTSGEKVLLGITRQMVVKACRALKIPVVEESVTVSELESVDAAFMTGTSVDVLPISHLDRYVLNSAHHSLVKQIREAYLSLCKIDLERVKDSCADDSN